ncbi:Transcription initiation factor TFIID subunit 5, partial [Fragariocoptes setiger]
MASRPPANKTSGDEPRKKKSRKDILPGSTIKIPIPELRDSDKQDRLLAQKEAQQRLKLSADTLPSILMYTILNARESSNYAALCCTIAEDSSMIAIGFSDSSVRVWPLTPQNLRQLRQAHELEEIDKEASDVMTRMWDSTIAFERKTLHGHSGPVFGVSISPDRLSLLSASEDTTIRLWSLQTWTNVCCYRGHNHPVWDVRFSPHGYYFASCSNDQTARLWATDNHQSLRIFADHLSDVDFVEFHPSSNSIATGSTDNHVRLWDVVDGSCMRTLKGHTGRILTIAFSIDGRFLVTGGADCRILVWDHAFGHLLAELDSHKDTIYTLSFSRCGAMLVSGGLDDCINVFDVTKLLEALDIDELSPSSAPTVYKNTQNLLLGAYRTKSTSILHLHFTRRNLLLAAGVFH